MSEPTNREVAVLNVALELRPAERAAYLDEACASDPALRQRVEDLLGAYAAAEGFLEAPPPGLGATRTFRLTVPPTEKPGDKIGHYKLLQQIGEGGCGVVYLAEQEEPVRRRVALKVIKLGMDTKQVIARFEAERQALALMDHPNIAKIFDAGVTSHSQLSTLNSQLPLGRPYFVMELVRGIKITDFCDQNKVSTADRLKLFIQVCQAIQHAHQKGIIHRDIKPSNILVTINDDVPVPKVIDFGIAKATQGRLTDQTLFTAFEQFIGTPAYMSPEQAVMTSLDIDTRSDIYSLGVLLYELLTGKTPFDQQELLAAGLDEMRRMIREKEPLRPSTRLSAMAAEALTTTAKHCHTDAPKLLHAVQGDLDWIVMKCLEKDRARRYETANGVAMDITRHLNYEPVVARPHSRLYEFQKTVRRHKVGFAATAAVIVALTAGMVASEWEARRAIRAESAIENEAQRARHEAARALTAENAMREERDRALRAEADQRAILGAFTSETATDSETVSLLQRGAGIVRERLDPTNEAMRTLLRPLAARCGRLGAWTNALGIYEALIAAEPNDHWDWYLGHGAALGAGEMVVSRELAAGMLARFGASRDPVVCQRLALSLLLSPARPSDWETASSLAARAAEGKPGWVWCRLVKAIAEYRLRRYAKAGELLQDLRSDRDPTVGLLAAYFLAMTRQQQGQEDAARLLLEEANRRFAEGLGDGDLAEAWHDQCRNLRARGEAEKVIWGRAVSPPITASSLATARQAQEPVRKLLRDGETLALERRWKESAAEYAHALQHPAFRWRLAQQEHLWCLALQMGVTFVKAGDGANYERLCRLLLALAPETHPGEQLERSAKTFFLDAKDLPAELRRRGVDLARLAVVNRNMHRDPPWLDQTGGMAEYHAGNLERALELLRQAEESDQAFCKGGAMAYRAMTLQRMGRGAEAAEVLHAAAQLIAEPLRRRSAGLSLERSAGLWWDLDICEMALDEARQLISQARNL